MMLNDKYNNNKQTFVENLLAISLSKKQENVNSLSPQGRLLASMPYCKAGGNSRSNY